ncbi:hypothetical protein [Orenia marismortui]|uniref:Winged helix DNA-binding protein n=1 Tax=Orenia marismortui TaxID=46469 RepID=A0A4R8GYU0_9FIRM|nr:hypothetical protein [Orenia marismortui]TDX51673.1 hypothetical protein C7959_11169 [Orenia marismortui]
MQEFSFNYSAINESEIFKCIYNSCSPIYLHEIEEKGFNKIAILRALEKGLERELIHIESDKYNKDKRMIWLTSKGKDFIKKKLTKKQRC